jgi:hypothetical protein
MNVFLGFRWIYPHHEHTISVKPKKKKTIARCLSEDVEGNKYNISFSSSLFQFICLQHADLAQPEMRPLCELVGTLNV